MFDPDWEDSLSTFDIRDLLYIEAAERLMASASGVPLRCVLSRCRRQRFCIGPMRQRAGARLPGPWKQLGAEGFRPLCLQVAPKPVPSFTLQDLLAKGPDCVRAMDALAVIPPGDLLGRRIAASRDARSGRKGGICR